MLKLKMLSIVESMDELQQLPEGKVLINTVNAHSFNTAQKDSLFADALMRGGCADSGWYKYCESLRMAES